MASSADFAARFEAAHAGFTRLIESLDDEQWAHLGKNFPQRINDEDESRPVGVIAHHVAISGPRIIDRIRLTLAGEAPPPTDFRQRNAEEALANARVSRQEVVDLLRSTQRQIAEAVRAIPDHQLETSIDTPAGPMTVAQRLERVLIGHITGHQG